MTRPATQNAPRISSSRARGLAGAGSSQTVPATVSHVVNLSGGKDSQACALLAAQRGKPFRLVMSDTGNENQITLDHAEYVADFVGVPLEIVRADFSAEIARKREYVARVWPEHGVPAERVERALKVLRPTGNPFIDLCIWKGRFPSRKAQFCTEFLKARAIEQAIIEPALKDGPLIQWLGVRRDESLNRRNAPMLQKVRRDDAHDMVLFRPIVHWTADNVFSFTAAHGMRHNPLYLQGMARVGCFPCINENKEGLRQIAARFPEVVEKLLEWEGLVKDASKWGAATFFASDVTPEGAALGRRIKAQATAWVRRNHSEVPERTDDGPNPAFTVRVSSRASDLSADAPWPRADAVFSWAKTDRGGRQFNLLDHAFSDDGLSCSSQYGLCE
ncbi:MAG: phosphoadenosine phosphosulfate reductase family protein [Rhodobacteraceae bacterium]|nr:phosphoadenosine phosphosulfate reductase family protein [Paracoccaceae bacterium]